MSGLSSAHLSGFPWLSIFPPCISSEPGALNGKDSLFSDAMPARDIPFRESLSIKCVSQMTLRSLLTQGRRHHREALSEQRPCVIGPAQSNIPSTAVFGEKTQAALSPWIPVSSTVRKRRICTLGKKCFQSSGTEAKTASFVNTSNEIIMKDTLLWRASMQEQ